MEVVKNHSSVISVSTHPINLDVGMSISKNKDEILSKEQGAETSDAPAS